MRNWLIVCLTLLQALMSMSGATAHGSLAHAQGVAATAVHCASTSGGDEAPAGDGGRSHCCLFCASCGCGGFGAAIASTGEALASVEHPSFAPSLRKLRLPRRPLGWTSSWSSRAPPFFS